MFRHHLSLSLVASLRVTSYTSPRLPAAVLAVALSAGVVPFLASAAYADQPASLFSMDVVTASGPSPVRVAPATGLAVTNPPNGLRLTNDWNQVLTLAPPTGQVLSSGSTFPVGGPRTDTTGSISTPYGCGQVGTVTVAAATLDTAGALTSLAASYETVCTNNAETHLAGVLRFNDTTPYVEASSSQPDVQTGVGMSATTTVTIVNTGTTVTVGGTAALSGPNASEYTVTSDGCSGATLPVNGGCRITLDFRPTALGARPAQLSVPLSDHPRAAGALLVMKGFGVAPPAAVSSVEGYAATGAAGITWKQPTGDVTGYRVYRGATLVASVPDRWGSLAAEDPGLASGASASYSVVAYGRGGDGPASDPVTVTRLASDPVTGTTNALVLEGLSRYLDADRSRSGDSVALTTSSYVMAYSAAATASMGVLIPVVPGPGSYALALNPTGSQRKLNLQVDSLSCLASSGTLDVTSAAYDSQLVATTFTGELHAVCEGGYPVEGSIRWNSPSPYAAAAVSPAQVSLKAQVGTAVHAAVTVTNRGTASLTVGTGQLTGDHPSDWSSSSCADPLAPGGTCALDVVFTPAATGPRNALLGLPLSTPSGTRTVTLLGAGGSVPGAVGSPQARAFFHRNDVTWTYPIDDGGTGVTSYRVERSLDNNAFAAVGGFVSTAVGHYVDGDVEPGIVYNYRITAVNQSGSGPGAETGSTLAVATSLVEQGLTNGVPDVRLMTDQAPTGFTTPLLGAGPPRYTPAGSPDGSQIVYAEADSFADTADTHLWIAPVDGSAPPVRLTKIAGSQGEPAWSPDGRTIAFSNITGSGVADIALWTVPAAGGTAVKRADRLSTPSWLPDSTRIVAEHDLMASLYVVDALGRTTQIPGSLHGYAPSVSPDGTKIAFIFSDGTNPDRLGVLPVAGGTGVLQASPDDWSTPSWSLDGKQLYAARYAGATSEVVTVAWSGGFGIPVSVGGQYEDGPHQVGEAVALTSQPAAYVRSTAATVAFVVPLGATARCSLDSAASSPCSGQVALTGLASGAHRLTVTASAPGRLDTVTTAGWVVDVTAPTATIVTPRANAASVGTSVIVAYRVTEAASLLGIDVRYRRAPSTGAYGGYTSPAGWTGTLALSRVLAVTPGQEYCFSVRARDVAGNSSAWSPDRCVDVALDDRSLVASAGWTRPAISGAYRNTVTTTTRTATTLSLRSVQTRRVTLVVTRCPSCGQVGVFLGATRIAVVETRASGTARKVLVPLPLLPSVRTGALTLRPLQAGRTVQIDGIAFGRA